MAFSFARVGSLVEIIKTVKNWFSVLLLYMGLRKNIVVVFRNGIKVEIPDKSQWDTIYSLIKIQLCSRILQVSDDTYKTVLGNMEVVFQLTDEDSIYRTYVLSRLCKELNMRLYPEHNSCEFYFEGKKVVFFFDLKDNTWIYCLSDTFIDNTYSVLNVRGRIVADIGASYGDTTLYFAFKGAKKVYAYEPIPWVAEILEKNVRLNNLSSIVKVYPYAVSFNEGEAILTVPKKTTMMASLYYDDIFKSNKKVEVKHVRVQKVTPPPQAEVAKIDCEGCEFDIILKWLKDRIYDEMIVEYHGDYRQLVKKLRELGYKVEFLKFYIWGGGLLYVYNER